MSGLLRFSEEFKEKREYLVNPILRRYSILQKSEAKVVFHEGRPDIITKRTNTYPLYLSDIGRLIALDITSRDLDSEFYDKTTDYVGTKSENKLMFSKLYNYDLDTARAVSWGNLSTSNAPEVMYSVYRENFLNDLFITPSILTKRGFYSPTRWFRVEANTVSGPQFEATVNYNIGLVYLDKSDLQESSKSTFWINDEIHLYEIPLRCLVIDEDGFVISRRITGFLPDQPDEDLIKRVSGGEYFIATFLSFNDYETNYSRTSHSGFNIHIVEELREFSFSEVDLSRLLFIHSISEIDLSSIVFTWSLDKEVVKNALRFLSQFVDSTSSIGSLGAYNRLLELSEEPDKYRIKMVNPAVIPHLLHRKIKYTQARGNPDDYLNGDSILSGLEEADKQRSSGIMDAVALPEFTRLNSLSEPRSRQYRHLRDVHKKFCGDLR